MANEIKPIDERQQIIQEDFLTKLKTGLKTLKDDFANSGDEHIENTKEKEDLTA